jgi:hypothetical protein
MQNLDNKKNNIGRLLQENEKCLPFFLLGSAGSGKTQLIKSLIEENISNNELFLYCGILEDEMREIMALYPGTETCFLETDSIINIMNAFEKYQGVFLKPTSSLLEILIHFLRENLDKRGGFFSDKNNIKPLALYVDESNEVLEDVYIIPELRKLGITCFVTCQFLGKIPEELLSKNFFNYFSNFCIFSIREEDTDILEQKGIISENEKNDILNQETGEFLFKFEDGSKKISLN